MGGDAAVDWGSVWYLGVSGGLLACLILIALRLYRGRNRDRAEEAKYRMMDDDEPKRPRK